MENYLVWPIVRLVQRLSMVLTFGCAIYVVYFLLMGNRGDPVSIERSDILIKDAALISPAPALDVKPYEAAVPAKDRDIFSSYSAVETSGSGENTPKGQLPAHLKIVGVLIADISQVIIEDASAKQTYFIDEGSSQAGIKVVQAHKDRVVINYQGQDIAVPVTKN